MQVSPALPLRLDRPAANKALASRFVPFRACSSKISSIQSASACRQGLKQAQYVPAQSGLHLPSRSPRHRVAASPPSHPDSHGDGISTSTKEASPSNSSSLNGTSAISNGKQNGTAPLSASSNENAVPAESAAAANVAANNGFIPHRWRIVLMMSMAFVLCNMDKVR